MILNCKDIRGKEIERIKMEEDLTGCKAVFVQVGENPASDVYVRNKIKLCEEVGIDVKHIHFSEAISEQELVDFIVTMNLDDSIHGIMVQLPLPKHINEDRIINVISPLKDLDGFTHVNKGKLMVGDETAMVACTPAGIMDILDHIGEDVKGKNVVIVGRSNIVGKPLAQLLINRGATVTVCNSSTPKKVVATNIACSEIFISAIGIANYFNKEFFDEQLNLGSESMLAKVAIDVGINRDENNKLCGDISRDLYDKFEVITPVPGGVGIMTVLNVIKNIIRCYKLQTGNK